MTHIPILHDCDTQAKELPATDTSDCVTKTKLLVETFAYLHNIGGTHYILSKKYEYFRWLIRLSTICYRWRYLFTCTILKELIIFLQNNRIITELWTMQNITYITNVSTLMTMNTFGSRFSNMPSPSSILHRLICIIFNGLRCDNKEVNIG